MPKTRTVRLGDRKIGPGQPVYIVAEAGVNHNGEASLAAEMIKVARDCGADAVKFQAFNPELMASRAAPLAPYQKRHVRSGRTQRTMLRDLQLSHGDFETLKKACEKCGMDFLVSPFDLESLDFLVRLSVKAIKIPSPELTNLPLLEGIAEARIPALLSTGAATTGEVKEAVGTLQSHKLRDVALFHCVSAYPAPYEQSNLRAIATLEAGFGLPVGYSDHSPGIHLGAAAVAAGALLLEKHFTLDRGLPGPDQALSLEPSELHSFVTAVRQVESALGDGVKKPQPSEIEVRDATRKSLVTTRAVKRGEKFAAADLTTKRPGTGIPPREMKRIVGRRAKCDIPADTVLTTDMV